MKDVLRRVLKRIGLLAAVAALLSGLVVLIRSRQQVDLDPDEQFRSNPVQQQLNCTAETLTVEDG
jgi:hypothetical protein